MKPAFRLKVCNGTGCISAMQRKRASASGGLLETLLHRVGIPASDRAAARSGLKRTFASNWHTLVMRQQFHQTITVLSNAFQRLEQQVPAPQLVPHGDGHVFRFAEKTLTQALLLKLARVVTGLRALDVLLVNGLLQEMASVCRMLDEIAEDIAFLVTALTNDEVTELHERYLRAFWAEEFTDHSNMLARHEKPDTPRRNKVQAYVHRALNSENPSQVSDVNQAMSSRYSGFVHASAPQVMDLYGGNPPRFHIEGMLGTPLMTTHVYDAWNYFYRAVLTTIFVARAFGDGPLSTALGDYHDRFLERSGERAQGVRPIARKEPPNRNSGDYPPANYK